MDEEIKKLIEDNIKLTKEVHGMVKSIKSYIFWAQLTSFVKIALIVIPLVFGYIYLSPILKDALRQYQELLGSSPLQTLDQNKEIDIKNLPPSVQKFLQ